MKPSLEEVLEKLAMLNNVRKKRVKHYWIPLSTLTEELDTHLDNLMPCLLLLKNEDYIEFNSGKLRLAVNVLKKEMAVY